jgi:hypothetical protein
VTSQSACGAQRGRVICYQIIHAAAAVTVPANTKNGAFWSGVGIASLMRLCRFDVDQLAVELNDAPKPAACRELALARLPRSFSSLHKSLFG